MKSLWDDLRYGMRALLKNPSYTAVALITLALGMGANSAVFSMVDALVFRPLPFSELDRLVAVYSSRPQQGIPKMSVAPADFIYWKNQNKSFDQLGFYRWRNVTIAGSGDPEPVLGFAVSTNFFQVLGVSAAAGRAFLPEEEQPGHEQVVVLSYGLWIRRFGGDPNIVGKKITLNSGSFTVVGIAPAGINYPLRAELWIPLSMTPDTIAQRANGSLYGVARLKPGVSLSQSLAEMNVIADQLGRQFPQTNNERKVTVVLLREDAAGVISSGITFALLGAAAFVLLIACANIANLQLARATGRRKEMAIRTALGASRWRIIHQMLTENILLSLLSAMLGLLAASSILKYTKSSIAANISQSIAGWDSIGLDGRALGFSFATALIAGIIFGFAPAREASKIDLTNGLKDGGRTSGSGVGRDWLRGVLVVSEIALGLTLLCGAGLMVRGFNNIVATSFQGFDADNVLTMRIAPQASRFQGNQLSAYFQQIVQGMSSLSMVQSAAAVGYLPGTIAEAQPFIIDGQPTLPAGTGPVTDDQIASPDYFTCLRAPLVKGRFFSESDNSTSPPIAIISETMARSFFPNQDPIGKRIRLGGTESDSSWLSIVGVVGDIKSRLFDKAPRPVVYRSYLQARWGSMDLTLRTTGDPKSAIAAAKAKYQSLNPGQANTQFKTLRESIDDQISGVRWAAVLMGAFGLLALILSGAGVYGVMSYNESQRVSEIGIRMALGARQGDVLKLIVGQAFWLVIVGLVIGVPMAIALNQVLSRSLFGGTTFEADVFFLLMTTLVCVAIFASYVPARRASKTDPLVAIRNE